MARLRPLARLLGRLLGFAGWLIAQNVVTVVWMAVLVIGCWMAWHPVGVIVSAVCLWQLEMKVEKDISDLR